jgi:hypothetical protein
MDGTVKGERRGVTVGNKNLIVRSVDRDCLRKHIESAGGAANRIVVPDELHANGI